MTARLYAVRCLTCTGTTGNVALEDFTCGKKHEGPCEVVSLDLCPACTKRAETGTVFLVEAAGTREAPDPTGRSIAMDRAAAAKLFGRHVAQPFAFVPSPVYEKIFGIVHAEPIPGVM